MFQVKLSRSWYEVRLVKVSAKTRKEAVRLARESFPNQNYRIGGVKPLAVERLVKELAISDRGLAKVA